MYNQSIFTQCTTIVNWTPCRNNKIPDLLGGPMSSLWQRIPIHSGPLPVSNCPPFDSYPFHQSPPPQPQYTINSDDINNHGLLRLGHTYRYLLSDWLKILMLKFVSECGKFRQEIPDLLIKFIWSWSYPHSESVLETAFTNTMFVI